MTIYSKEDLGYDDGMVKYWLQIAWRFTLFLALLAGGCASLEESTPNVSVFQDATLVSGSAYDDSHTGRFQSQLTGLAAQNHLLAQELGKLPELQESLKDGRISVAVDMFMILYGENPGLFNAMFKRMYRVGLPGVRRYCAPLQAFFWLVEDGQVDLVRHLLSRYSLENLLCVSWPSGKFYRATWPEGIIEKQAGSCSFSPIQFRSYLLLHSLDYVDFFLYRERENPGAFEFENDTLLYQVFVRNREVRWRDFTIIADRLNAPELIDFYERHNLSYEYYLGSRKSNATVLISRKANCVDTTELTIYCLKRAGYRAESLIVSPEGRAPADSHQITKYYHKGQIFIMDNGRSNPVGILGPLNTIEGSRYWLNPAHY
jgi:hypothetical protein